MVQIDIEIPRPWSLLFWSGAAVAAFVWYSGSQSQPAQTTASLSAEGGTVPAAVSVHQAENDAKSSRMRQEVLSRREDILRIQIEALESEWSNDPDMQDQILEARERLAELLLDKRAAEQEIAQSLEEIWEAQGYAVAASNAAKGSSREVRFIWPLEPSMGLSAHFDDEGYLKRFGIPHQAVDIPGPQGSVVYAAADGEVTAVNDNGKGFNSVVIKHTSGMATLYGHVTKFLVAEGDEVHAGDAIALSGGTPGTDGAGHLTTGPHLHFQLLLNGVPVDPMDYLPPLTN